jgi:hypothetical protein
MSQDALDLLLSGVKDQGQRKQITSAYYAFANGDPETFAVQFAVLLRAHAISLKLLPGRLGKALAAETRKVSDLVIAHQNSIQRMASLMSQEAGNAAGGEGRVDCDAIQTQIEKQLGAHADILAKERERMISAFAANERLLERLTTQRVLPALIVSYIGGLVTVPIFQSLVAFFSPLLR